MAKLYFYYSTMNAGKSTALLQASHNFRERGMPTLVYTAAVDQRGAGRVSSRIGISGDAHHFDAATDFLADADAAHRGDALGCVLIDEAQFLEREQVRALGRVVDELGVPVLCYGLRTDFRGELFPGSAALTGRTGWRGTRQRAWDQSGPGAPEAAAAKYAAQASASRRAGFTASESTALLPALSSSGSTPACWPCASLP